VAELPEVKSDPDPLASALGDVMVKVSEVGTEIT